MRGEGTRHPEKRVHPKDILKAIREAGGQQRTINVTDAGIEVNLTTANVGKIEQGLNKLGVQPSITHIKGENYVLRLDL